MIFLTGGSGFLGKAILMKLSEKGIRVRALYRKGNPKQLANVDWVKADLLEEELPKDMLDGCTCIIHCAAMIKGSRRKIREVNLEGTKKLLGLVASKNIRKFIFMSSIDAALFKNTYAESKRLAEKAVRDSGLAWEIIRSSIIFGLEDKKNFFLLNKIVKKSPIMPLPFSGRFKWEPVFVEDLAEFIVKRAIETGSSGDIFSIVGPETLTFRQIINILEDFNKVKRLVLPLPRQLMLFLQKATSTFVGREKSDEIFNTFCEKIAFCGEGEKKVRMGTKFSAVFCQKE